MHKKFYLPFIVIFFFFHSHSQNIECNNWLSTPTYGSAVNIGDLDVSGNQLTVEAVIHEITPNTQFEGDIVAKHISPSDNNYLLRPNFGSITTTNGYFETPTICPINSNQNYHVAMVYDGSSLKFYRNGFLMSQVSATGNLVQNNYQTRIGFYDFQDYNSQFFGLINEVRIWNIARSQAELKATIFASIPNPTAVSGLLGYYVFDDLINKQGNAIYNGTIDGAASINTVNPNCTFIIDSCISAIACNTWLLTPSTPSAVNLGDLDVSGNKLTIEAVINQVRPNLEYDGDIVAKHTSPLNNNYLLRPNYCSITTTNGFFQTPPICPLNSGQNYHVAMVYDGSTLKFYRDGFLMSQINATGNLFQNNHNARIGYYALQDYNSQFYGYINEVKIWDTALSQLAIREGMFTSLSNPTSKPGLLGYYVFNDLLNKQGNAAYNGVLNGAAGINATNPDCDFLADTCLFTTPVIITSFSANTIGNKTIRLNWHTEEENNIASYTIQRSAGTANNFETIGNITARNNLKSNDYIFTDENVQGDIIYHYRLLISESNGTKKYSAIRIAKITKTDSQVTVYPNPNNGLISLKIQNLTGVTSLRLQNAVGQIIFIKTMNASIGVETTININAQPKGNYYLYIQTDKEKIIKKIIKL